MTDEEPRALIRSELPRYGRLPRALVRDPDMPDRAVRLYGLLDDYADADGKAFPSRSTLAEAMGCSVDSVDRAVKALEAKGWLLREVRRRADRTFESTLYTLTMGSRTGAATSRTGAEGGSRTGADRRNTTEKETTTPHRPPTGGDHEPALIDLPHVNGQTGHTGPVKRREVSDDDPAWSRFWSLYPRKEGKGAARKAWPRAIDKAPVEVILAAVEQFAGRTRDVRYCPHPTTWLNQERWADQPAVVTAGVSYAHGDGPGRVMTADEWAREGRDD